MRNRPDGAGERSRVAAVLRPQSAPGDSGLSICPHCWAVNPFALHLCARCGADMGSVLQESGGLRLAAPIQSPTPWRGRRLGRGQRIVLGLLAALLLFANLVGAGVWLVRGAPPERTPAGATAP